MRLWRHWNGVALKVHAIVSAILLAFAFYVVLTPVALVRRLAGKDPLALRMERGRDSYWRHRDPTHESDLRDQG